MAGTLFVVATPIGNLEDLSFRALRTLREVDLVAAEDTRRTLKLLSHYAVRKPLVSLRQHNERRETPKLIARLLAGESVALVSDAGTPAISDPGHHLVNAAKTAGIRVSPIPGPSAIMAALSASGEPADQFVFMGFPPRSGALRLNWISRLTEESRTVVFFEAPHRIAKTLIDISHISIRRPIHIHRELTKINEELVIYSNSYNHDKREQLGEFVIVVGQSTEIQVHSSSSSEAIELAAKMFYCLTENNSFDIEVAERLSAMATSVDQRRLHNALKKARFLKKRRDEALS